VEPHEPIHEEPRRRLAPALLAAAAVVVVVAVVVAAVQVRNLVQSTAGRAGGHTVDRSQPVLLQSIRDLARYEAASGNFQVIVDLEKDAGFIPPAILGQRTLFVAVGSVDAYVDFTNIGSSAVSVSDDRTSVRVRLPHAALEKPNLDHQRSYVVADERGIVDRLRSFFDREPNLQSELYQLSERRIAEAAAQSGLAERAETNTRLMMQGMLRSVGYEKVAVTFEG